MLKATLQSLLGHRLRLALTAVAVVLGVAFVSGTFVFTDTLDANITRIFSQANAGVSVTVRGAELAVSSLNGDTPRRHVPTSLLQKVRGVDGVADAQGIVQGQISILDRNRQDISSAAPSFGVNWIPNQRLSGFRLRQGSAPRGDTEVVIDLATAASQHFQVGQQIQIVAADGIVRPFTVAGLFTFGTSGSLGGARFAAFETPVAQQLLDFRDGYDTIDVQSRPGVTDQVLRGRVASVVGKQFEVITGADAARQQQQQIEQGLSFFNIGLLVFGAIALFVGSFLIVNTFSILVVQRSREFSLLRALGATRRQVLASVLTEALIVGSIASAAGVAAGIGLAKLLFWIFSAAGLGVPAEGLSIQLRTVAVGMLLGTAITVVSSLLPARRATRSAPVAALRESVPEAQPVTLRRMISGLLLFAIGVLLIVLGLFVSSDQRLIELGAGALVGFVGVAVLSPLLVRPVASTLGWPIARFRGVPGVLARENAQRSPRRTASTAAALMIGLAVVACFSSIAASYDASLAQQVGGAQKADFQVRDKANGEFSVTVAGGLLKDPRLRDVEEVRIGGFRQLNGDQASLIAVGVDNRAATIGIDAISGSASDLSRDTLLISETAANSHGWRIGSEVLMKLQDSAIIRPTVAGIYRANGLLGDYVIALSAYAPHVQQQRDLLLLVNGALGRSLAQTRAALTSDLAPFATLQVQDRAQFISAQEGQLAVLLNVIYALLALSLIIALLGIVNTLALSVIERTRELGLLRALGLTRSQTRSMVRWESVIIALLGALMGIVIGVALAAAIVRALYDQGVTQFAVAGVQLFAAAVFAFSAGIVAAIFPARRAARLRLLDALATE